MHLRPARLAVAVRTAVRPSPPAGPLRGTPSSATSALPAAVKAESGARSRVRRGDHSRSAVTDYVGESHLAVPLPAWKSRRRSCRS